MLSILLAKPTKIVNDVPVKNTVNNALVSLSSTSMATQTTKLSARTKETLAIVPFASAMPCSPKLMSKLKTFGTETTTVSGQTITKVSTLMIQTTAQLVQDQLICNAVRIVISLHLTCGIML